MTSRFPGVSRTLSSGKSANRRNKSFNGSKGNNTPMTTSYTLSPVIAAITEGRGPQRGHIGLAAIDMTSMDFHLFTFVDSAAYSSLKTQLQVLEPIEVLVCDSINERSTNVVLHEAIRSVCDQATISAVQRRYFETARGFEMYRTLRTKHNSVAFESANTKELCLAAFAALVKYVEHIEGVVFAHSTLRVSFHEDAALCKLDAETWENLRVIDRNGRNGAGKNKERRTLFSLLNTTLTSPGARFLRQSLMQPLNVEDDINARLDAVEEMIDRAVLVDRARSLLARAHSLDSILPIVVRNYRDKTVAHAEHRIVQLMHLQQTLQLVEPLRQLLPMFNSSLISTKAEDIGDDRLPRIREILDEILDVEMLKMKGSKNSMAAKNQRCFAVKDGLSVTLDVSRKAYEELLLDLQNDTGELQEQLPNEPVRLAYSAARLFHYVWVTQDANRVRVPPHFINIVRNKASLTFSSRYLMRYNDRIEQSACEVLLASDDVISIALEQIRPLVDVLYTLIDTISLLDFLCALVTYATERDAVRPSFGPSIIVSQGRYPLLDVSGSVAVPNDEYMTPTSPFALITGPNMAGKSTYTRQVGSLSLLAQMGSFVPARGASLPVFRRISSRVGQNDTLAENLSSFAMEMNEMAVILACADNKTLVLIDELARSTSVEEGIGISYAIIEELIERKSFVVFTSHFLDLATLDASYSAIENYHFAPQTRQTPDGEVLDPSHSLFRGSYSGPLYGFEVAELSALPSSMLDRARELADRLHQEWRDRRAEEMKEARQRVLLRAAHCLQKVTMEPPTAATVQALIQIRNQLLEGLESCEEEQDEESSQNE